MYPWEIPKRVGKLIEEGTTSEEDIYKICVENIVKIYGVNPP